MVADSKLLSPSIGRNRWLILRSSCSIKLFKYLMYDETVLDKVQKLKRSDRGELEITDVNNAYIAEGTMTFAPLDGWWTDAGTFGSLLRANNLVAATRGHQA